MILSAGTMRLFLLLTVLGMALIAAFYLSRRQLTLMQYLGWGVLAVLLPLLGPFLVILLAPGAPFPEEILSFRRRQHCLRQLSRHLRRMII